MAADLRAEGLYEDHIADEVLRDTSAIVRPAAEAGAALREARKRTQNTDDEATTTFSRLDTVRRVSVRASSIAVIILLILAVSHAPTWSLIVSGGVGASSLVLLLNVVSFRNQHEVTSRLRQRRLEERQRLTDYESALCELGIRPRVREVIGAHAVDPDSTILNVRSAEGLAEVGDVELSVDTQASLALEHLMRRMPGGSVGLAGARGTGKTTLINGFVHGRFTFTRRRLVSFAEAAPVEYNARDFVLHVFATFCHRILAVNGIDSRNAADMAVWRGTTRYARSGTYPYAVLLATIAVALGSFLIVTTLLPQAAHLRDPGLVSGVLIAGAGLMLFVVAAYHGRAPMQTPTSARFLGARQTTTDEYLLRTEVINDALDALFEMRFQQSYSSGWAGQLDLPVGFQAGLSATLALAQMQMSLPEVASRFRDLAKKMVDLGYTILIGIDEVDKIDDSARACAFLNDIKMLFGVPECYFLVSVSQDAMKQFHLRGVPLRDAFDSAFDEILSVAHLDLEAADRLVRRRVIGVSQPFLALAYCLAGGVPRDIIRSVRRMVNLTLSPGVPNSLDAIARTMIALDLQEKADALIATASDNHPAHREEPTASQPFGAVQQMDRVPDSEAHELIDFLWEVERISPDALAAADLRERSEYLLGASAYHSPGKTQLRVDIATVMSFVGVLLRVFCHQRSQAARHTGPEHAATHQLIHRLGRARRSMAVDTFYASRQLASIWEELDTTADEKRRA